MNFETMRGRWQQVYGSFLELCGSTRSNSQLWIKGRHMRIGGMLLVCQNRARLALIRAEVRRKN